MKIMIVAPMWLPIPAKAYGGTERVVEYLTNGLVDRGHYVVLSCHGQAQTRASKLLASYPAPLRQEGVAWSDLNYDMIQGAEAVKHAEDHHFDLIIFHSSWPHQLPFAALSKVPAVYVTHGVWTMKDYAHRHDKSELDVLYAFKDLNFISISQAQQQMVPGLNYVGNVYNGINLDDFEFQPEGQGYAAWIGRMDEHKGPHLAIQVAKQLGLKLKMAGPLRLEIDSERRFFEEQIEPHLGADVELVGELETTDKSAFLGGADVLLNPYVYNEAFGLVTAEALACGTPVVVSAWGGGPEIIQEGVSGYTGSNIAEWTVVTQKALKLDRAACRRRAEQFSIQTMVQGYEKIAHALIRPSWKGLKSVKQPALSHFPNLSQSVSLQAAKGGRVVRQALNPDKKPGLSSSINNAMTKGGSKS